MKSLWAPLAFVQRMAVASVPKDGVGHSVIAVLKEQDHLAYAHSPVLTQIVLGMAIAFRGAASVMRAMMAMS